MRKFNIKFYFISVFSNVDFKLNKQTMIHDHISCSTNMKLWKDWLFGAFYVCDFSIGKSILHKPPPIELTLSFTIIYEDIRPTDIFTCEKEEKNQ